MPVGQPCAHHPALPVVGACDRCGDFGCKECLPLGRTCLRCAPNQATAAKPDIAKTFSWFFRDPSWPWKVAGGALCFLTYPFLLPLFVLLGYHLRIARREREGPQERLPDWDALGSLLWDGFKFWVATSLPMFLVYGFFLASMLAFVFVSFPPGTKPPPQPPPAFMIGVVALSLVWVPIALAFFAAFPAIQIEYLRTGSIFSPFHWRSLWKTISSHPVDYAIFVAIAFALYVFSTLAGEMMCFVGLLATCPIGLFIEGAFLGRYCAWLDEEDRLSAP